MRTLWVEACRVASEAAACNLVSWIAKPSYIWHGITLWDTFFCLFVAIFTSLNPSQLHCNCCKVVKVFQCVDGQFGTLSQNCHFIYLHQCKVLKLVVWFFFIKQRWRRSRWGSQASARQNVAVSGSTDAPERRPRRRNCAETSTGLCPGAPALYPAHCTAERVRTPHKNDRFNNKTSFMRTPWWKWTCHVGVWSGKFAFWSANFSENSW